MSNTTPNPDPAPTGSGWRSLAGDPVALLALAVSVASAALTVWGVTALVEGLAPLPVALLVGGGVEAAWLYVLMQEWQQSERGRTDKKMAIFGWALAAAAVAVLSAHAWLDGWALLAVAWLPLGAKAGWHLRIAARQAEAIERQEADRERAAAEADARREAEAKARAEAEEKAKKDAELSEGLTYEQQVEIAKRRRTRAFTEALAAEDDADAEAEHNRRLTEIQRRAAEQMAADREAAQIDIQRHQLRRTIELSSPVVSAVALPRVPDDASSISDPEPPTAGFGAALAEVRNTPKTPADQKVPTLPTVSAHHSTAQAERNRQTVLTAVETFQAQGRQVSISALAKATGLSRRTVTRHLPTVSDS